VLESQGVPVLFESGDQRAFDGLFAMVEGAGRLRVFEDDQQRAETILEAYQRAQNDRKEELQ